MILVGVGLLLLWQKSKISSPVQLPVQPTPAAKRYFESTISGITAKRNEMKIYPDGNINFTYEDSGDWETDNQLKNISINDLPFEEKTVPVDTPLSFRLKSFFPVNDYNVTGLPWKVLIVNSHSRGLYEEFKSNHGTKEYTLVNWDYHDDANQDYDDYVYDPHHITIADWVGNAYYYGVAKDPVYWFNCFAKKPDSDYPVPGTWEMSIPLTSKKSVPLPGILINVTPEDTTIATSYFKNLVDNAPDNSIWLSLDGDCFSEPGGKQFAINSFRAKMLNEVLWIAAKNPKKIAFIHYVRSPDYTGDVPGINRFFIREFQSIANSRP